MSKEKGFLKYYPDHEQLEKDGIDITLRRYCFNIGYEYAEQTVNRRLETYKDLAIERNYQYKKTLKELRLSERKIELLENLINSSLIVCDNSVLKQIEKLDLEIKELKDE